MEAGRTLGSRFSTSSGMWSRSIHNTFKHRLTGCYTSNGDANGGSPWFLDAWVSMRGRLDDPRLPPVFVAAELQLDIFEDTLPERRQNYVKKKTLGNLLSTACFHPTGLLPIKCVRDNVIPKKTNCRIRFGVSQKKTALELFPYIISPIA